jgi:DNA-binding NtrC family response regulator
LRERREDIVPLFEHALAKVCRRYGRRVPSLSREQRLALAEYAWPGNVRELQNVVERAVLLAQ